MTEIRTIFDILNNFQLSRYFYTGRRGLYLLQQTLAFEAVVQLLQSKYLGTAFYENWTLHVRHRKQYWLQNTTHGQKRWKTGLRPWHFCSCVSTSLFSGVACPPLSSFYLNNILGQDNRLPSTPATANKTRLRNSWGKPLGSGVTQKLHWQLQLIPNAFGKRNHCFWCLYHMWPKHRCEETTQVSAEISAPDTRTEMHHLRPEFTAQHLDELLEAKKNNALISSSPLDPPEVTGESRPHACSSTTGKHSQRRALDCSQKAVGVGGEGRSSGATSRCAGVEGATEPTPAARSSARGGGRWGAAAAGLRAPQRNGQRRKGPEPPPPRYIHTRRAAGLPGHLCLADAAIPPGAAGSGYLQPLGVAGDVPRDAAQRQPVTVHRASWAGALRRARLRRRLARQHQQQPQGQGEPPPGAHHRRPLRPAGARRPRARGGAGRAALLFHLAAGSARATFRVRRKRSPLYPEPSRANKPGKVRRVVTIRSWRQLGGEGAWPGPPSVTRRMAGTGGTRLSASAAPAPSRAPPRIRPGAASAPTRVPAAGRSQPPGAAAGLHRAHTALPRGSANHPPLAGIHQTVSRKEEGGEIKKKKSQTHEMMLGSGFGFPPPAPPPAGSSQAKFSRKGLVLEADNNKQLEKWFVALLEGSSSTTSFFAVTDHSYRSSRDRGAQWAARPAPLLAVSRIPRLRQRDLMEEVAAAQSFQVRPVRQLPGSPQERQQLSFSPGARRGATPTGKLRARSAAAPELAGAEQPGGGAPPAAERSRRREATRRLLHSPPWTIGWHRRPQAGSPPRSKVPTAAAREKRSGERPSAPNRRSAPPRPARRPSPRSHGAGSAPRAALYRGGGAAPPRPRPQRPAPRSLAALPPAPARPRPGERGGGRRRRQQWMKVGRARRRRREGQHPWERGASPRQEFCGDFLTRPPGVKRRERTGLGSAAMSACVVPGGRGRERAEASPAALVHISGFSPRVLCFVSPTADGGRGFSWRFLQLQLSCEAHQNLPWIIFEN